ncbi:5-formyltetrahydrofolate cyclo-ligase [Sediminibacillus albus]|uniref:5-formyltetrahydrofolate cyclo-ligase n=2 Tax=Sediminibacillus albus TaxID=407036 RepID=A0A1G9CT06_9BACI|nr:5-formyltetrahydrofolate cyclo-ligase [Sediminibacillus albus]
MLKNLPSERRRAIEEGIARHLFDSSFWQSADMVALTVSQKHEWDTSTIIEQAWKENKTVCVPKCFPAKPELVFYQLQSYSQLECVYMDLLEPNPELTCPIDKQRIDLVIVPGLFFDRDGYRVGYGGGYYDRYLAGFQNLTLALTSNEQMIEECPRDDYDIPVDHIITEDGLLF